MAGVALGGRGVQVATRRVGAGVLVGAAVQVGRALSQTRVGDGPGVPVGQGVSLGVSEKTALGVGEMSGASVAAGEPSRGSASESRR